MSEKSPVFTLLRNATVLAPENLGKRDVLLAGRMIAAVGENLAAPAGYDCEVVDLAGCTLLPGLIDSHVHLIGGGGEGGYATRTPEIQLSKVTTSGVTTVVGCLGTDGTTRHVESLLAKARGLETEGISTYIYSGAYELPTPTVTGGIRRDIILIDKVIGAGEIAMSDHRSAQPSVQEYRKLIAEARVGGMLSGKAGIVDMHMGDGADGLKPLFEITANGEIPKTQILPTHVNRNPSLFEESLEWARQGGYMDITSGIAPTDDDNSGCIKPSKAAKRALDAGVKASQITMSSDGNGSMPIFDAAGNTVGVGVASQATLLQETRDMILEEGIAPEVAVQFVTSNVAKALKLWPQKGCVAVSSDADLLAVDEKTYELRHVWAKGRHMVAASKPLVKGTFE